MVDKVKDTVELDIKQANPFTGTKLEDVRFDAITTSLCLQAAGVTIEEFRSVLQNIRCVELK